MELTDKELAMLEQLTYMSDGDGKQRLGTGDRLAHRRAEGKVLYAATV